MYTSEKQLLARVLPLTEAAPARFKLTGIAVANVAPAGAPVTVKVQVEQLTGPPNRLLGTMLQLYVPGVSVPAL